MSQVNALLRQVESSVRERDKDTLISALETLAKIAWSDDEASSVKALIGFVVHSSELIVSSTAMF
jgi:hypothetical protein